MNTLVRPNHGRMIAGVCSAIAQRTGMPVWVIRAAAIASCLLPGPQFVIYLAAWGLTPSTTGPAPLKALFNRA